MATRRGGVPRTRGGPRTRGEGSSRDEIGPQWYFDTVDSKFDGGPKEDDVLNAFGDHIAHRIWEMGKTTRDVSKFTFHNKPNAFDLWPLSAEKNKAMIKKCEDSGLRILWEAHVNHLNKPLIHALIERFMPETNTFHLPVGEVTVTLDDVFKITKLSIDGELLMGERVKHDEGMKLAEELLGMRNEDAAKHARDGNMLITTLRSEYKGQLGAHETDEEVIDWYVRAYLLYVLGSTLFSDKSGSKVSLTWLKDLVDVKTLHTKGWGLAALVYLYKQLATASRENTAQMAGYVQLVEVWAYLHIPGLLLEDAEEHEEWDGDREEEEAHTPYLQRYAWSKPENNNSRVDYYRQKLDEVDYTQFVWYPYGYKWISSKLWRFSGYLVCHELFEPHPADRVCRQLGEKQNKPGREVLKRRLTHVESRASHETLVTYMEDISRQVAVDDRIAGDELELDPNLNDHHSIYYKHADDYYLWYNRKTHLRVTPPSIETRREQQKYMEDVHVDVACQMEELITTHGKQMEKHLDMMEHFQATLKGLKDI